MLGCSGLLQRFCSLDPVVGKYAHLWVSGKAAVDETSARSKTYVSVCVCVRVCMHVRVCVDTALASCSSLCIFLCIRQIVLDRQRNPHTCSSAVFREKNLKVQLNLCFITETLYGQKRKKVRLYI